MLRAAHVFACLSLAVVSSLTVPTLARACGCVSPPIPDGVGEFAVNQQAEQIIFEVGAGTVSAHVLVRFAGAPEEFAWIVPVPNVVDVELSESLMFPILDQLTAPRIAVVARDVCPDPEFVCDHHPALHCGDDDEGGDGDGDDDGDKDSGGGDGGDSEDPDGIDIDLKKQIGAYDIIAFGADEAGKAVAWLQDNGFIVNDSMTPFMEPYVALGMHFVAAKLIPAADVQEIPPLKLTYEGEHPMIPLRLTAVAAEPHMPVMAWIYGETSYGPMVKPLITLDAAGLAADTDGNNNYGSLVARSIADSGDAAFVAEYSGRPPTPDFNQDSYCCDYGGDYCGIADDSICQCRKTDFDHADCAAIEGLLESITALEGLAASHAHGFASDQVNRALVRMLSHLGQSGR